ncbi:hypothetical protein [Cesiribacter sp. SM1]|uniref:hypothetical protein n=1 Tax=Cesiribacter sp. SM1 TaxID=2861196 RepID=UPI001CD47BBC|nr:hypothetical protein [Cesiribacter sp. SM1]
MKVEDVELGLEKYVFLLSAEEGNYGIYELVGELSYYPLSIEDKYKIARGLLRQLVEEDLIIMVQFKDSTLKEVIKVVSVKDIDEVLNNPISWYPCGEMVAIKLTDKGTKYLDSHEEVYKGRLTGRWGKI